MHESVHRLSDQLLAIEHVVYEETGVLRVPVYVRLLNLLDEPYRVFEHELGEFGVQ